MRLQQVRLDIYVGRWPDRVTYATMQVGARRREAPRAGKDGSRLKYLVKYQVVKQK